MASFDARIAKAAIETLGAGRVQLWNYRTGQLKQLVDWCAQKAVEEAILGEYPADDWFYFLGPALTFAEDLHNALNPEGAKLLYVGAIPAVEAPNKERSTWLNTTGTLWNHDDPRQHLDYWQAAFQTRKAFAI